MQHCVRSCVTGSLQPISEVVRRDDAGGAMLFTYCNAYCPPD